MDVTKRIDEHILNEQFRKYYGGTSGANTYFFYILKPFLGKNIDGWKFYMEDMVGTFYFEKGKISVYATPFWEGADGVSVYAADEDYNSLGIEKTFPIKITGDSKKDTDTYFKMMKSILSKLRA
jgi:hypothetical protein